MLRLISLPLVAIPMSLASLTAPLAQSSEAPAAAENSVTLEELGETLFFDNNLSKNRTQSCATCHSPAAAFTDPMENGLEGPTGRAASLGDDQMSIGDRNAPTATYAALIPDFHKNEKGEWVGGQFHDGRALGLPEQAEGPPLNPVEMGMPDTASVVERLKEDEDYIRDFKFLFGDQIFNNPDETFIAMTKAIAAFERTEDFVPFDSRYDRFLRGEAEFSELEKKGMALFFDKEATNCSTCHQLQPEPEAARETFSNYRYFNVGVPVNSALRAGNGSAEGFIDHGLLQNPDVDDPAMDGKFKTMTLRNVAVTGPYMHNGVFANLETVVRFFNKYNDDSAEAQINPETGKPWAAPEVPATVDHDMLANAKALDDDEINALVAFMKTLTDEIYEDLIEE